MLRAFGFVASFGALLLLASEAPGQPIIVEAPFTVVLTASFSQPIATGSRIARIRVTNRDLIEEFKEQFGVSGRRARLVVRRDLADEEDGGSQLFMILDNVDYPVEGFIQSLPLSLPEGFYGRASSHKLNRRTGALAAFYGEGVSALAMGDLAVDGFSMGLFSLDKVWLRPLASVPNAPPLGSRFISQVTGGMQVSGAPVEDPLLVTGRLIMGAERVISP